MFTDPGGDYDFVSIFGAIAYFFAVIMETREFSYTHVFHFKECLEGSAVYFAALRGGYALQQGIKVYKDKNTQENSNA